MATTCRRVLTGTLVSLLLGSTAARGQVPRTVKSSTLPSSIKQQILTGAAMKVTATPPDTTAATAGDTARAAPPPAVTRVAPAREFMLRPGELLATRVGDRPVVIRPPVHADSAVAPDNNRPAPGDPGTAAPDSAIRLPYAFVGLDREDGTPTVYWPFVIPEGPLRYQPEDEAFVGTLLLGVQDSAHPAEARELSGSVTVRFGGDFESVTPDTVSLHTTNSQVERVRLLIHGPIDSVRLLVVPTFDPQGVNIWLPVQPALRFDPASTAIQGFGIERANLTLITRGVRPSDSIVVTPSLERGKGELATSQFTLTGGGAVVHLRSAGLGQAVVRAYAAGALPAEATITYRWPLAFLVAALLGGALGALVAFLNLKTTPRPSMAGFLVRGILVGLVVCAVYFGVGINLLQFQVDIRYFNEIVVFALAALAGLFGIPALSGAKSAKSG